MIPRPSPPQPDTERDLELIERALGYAPSGLADRVRQIARALAARLAETEARWQEMEHPFDQSEYDAMFARAEAAQRRVATLEAEREKLVLLVRIGFLVTVGGERATDEFVKHPETRAVLQAIIQAADTEAALAALDSVSSQPAQPNEEEQAADPGEAESPSKEPEQSASQQ